MNWEFIISRILLIIVVLYVIYLAYTIPISTLRSLRKNADEPATFKFKAGWFVRMFICCVVICSVAGSMKEGLQWEIAIIGTIVTYGASVFGLMDYFTKDAKMTLQERNEDRVKLRREEELGI